MQVKDIILVSDLDGTIIPSSGVITQKNINAIKRFRELGGTFSIATGRAPLHAKYLCDILGVEGMIVCNNGACIFDVLKEKIVWAKNLDSGFKDIIKYVIKNFKEHVAIQAISDNNKYFLVNETVLFKEAISKHFNDDDIIDVDNLVDNICKVLFLIDEDVFDTVANAISEHTSDEFELVRSGGACFEMMSKGVTKGLPLPKLAELYGKSIANVAAIGDYYNDIELLKNASISAAVGNAPDIVKQAASFVVNTCDKDGFSEFVDFLIEKYN